MTDTQLSPSSAGSFAFRAKARHRDAFSAGEFLEPFFRPPFDKKFSPENLAELSSLAAEKTPEMFFAGLLSFGQRLQDQGKVDLAAEVYSAIVGAGLVSAPGHGGGRMDAPRPSNDLPAGGRTQGPPLQVANLAQKRLNAILGKGSFGPRAEVLLGNFAGAASDYRMIVPMIAGSAVYNLARTAALARFTASAGRAWYQTGMGARLSSGLVGFAFEVPTFSLSSRSLMHFSGEAVSWDSGAVGKDLLGATLTLGALKLFGYVGNRAFLKTHGFSEFGVPTRLNSWAKFSQVAYPQAAMFGGMLAAHKLEEGIGLRPHVDGATTVMDTLASLLSLGIGSHLGNQLLGPRFAGFHRELGTRASLQSKRDSTPNMVPILAVGPRTLLGTGKEAERIRSLNVVWMEDAENKGPENGSASIELPKEALPKPRSAATTSRSALLKRLNSVLQEQPDRIEEAVEAMSALSKTKYVSLVWTVVDRRLQSDPEDAVEILMSFRDLAAGLPLSHYRAAADGALELAGSSQNLIGPALRLMDTLGSVKFLLPSFSGNKTERIFAGIKTLGRISPELAETTLENLAARQMIGGGKHPALLLMRILGEIGQLPEATRQGVLQVLEPLVREAFGQPWVGKPSEILKRAHFATVQIENWERFLKVPERPAETARLIRHLALHPGSGDVYRQFNEVYEQAGISKAEMLSAWDALSAQSVGAPELILEFYRNFSQVLSEATAARLVSHPEFYQAAKAERLVPNSGSFIMPLLDISFVPEVEQQFHTFVRKSRASTHLGSTHRFIETFGEMALQAMEGRPELVEQDVLWEMILPKKLSPEGRRDFFALLAEIRTSRPSSNPPAPNREPIELPRGLFEAAPRPPDRSEDPSSAAARNNNLVLKQIAALLKLAAGKPGSEELRWGAGRIYQTLLALPSRPLIDRVFQRTDLALSIHRTVKATEEIPPGILPILEKDLDELIGERGDDRGVVFERWILRMERQKFPSRVELAERILQAAVTTPPRHRLHPGHESGEQAALETLHSFLTPKVQEILDALPLSERGRRLYEKIRGMARRYEESRGNREESRLLEDIDALFYGGPEERELDALEADQLLLPKAPNTQLLGAGGAKPSPGADQSTALTRVTSGGELMAFGTFTPNPRTGLMEIDLGGGNKMALWHAVAPVRSEDAQEARRDWHLKSAGSLSEAHRDLSALDRDYDSQSAQAIIPQATSTALELSRRLDAARNFDSIRMMLESRLGAKPEEVLLDKIAAAMSIRQGLDMLEMALKQGNGHSLFSLLRQVGKIDSTETDFSLKNIHHLNQFSPNVTTLDVALTSLAEKAPRILLNEAGVAMPYRILVSGIEWASDDYDPATQRHGLFPVDPYRYIGVTGEGASTEYTHFTTWISKLIMGSLKTQLSDRHLFNHLYRWHEDASVAGLKMLKESGNPRFLLNKEIVDIEHSQPWTPSETARLIGLLERLPACLNTEQPGKIYFKPFAGGVLFLDIEARPIEFVGYHPHLQRTGFQEIHYKTEGDLSDDNRLAHQFLGDKLTSKLFDAALEQTVGGGSLLEDRVLDFTAKHRIALAMPTRTGQNLLSEEQIFSATTLEGTGSLKMGILEVEALDVVLSSIHPFVLARAKQRGDGSGGIQVIRKELSSHLNFLDWSRRTGKLGEYRAADGSIILEHMQERPFGRLDAAGRQLWKDTVLHEVAEAYFESLSLEEREAFISIYPWRSGLPGADFGARIPSSVVLNLLGYSDLTPALEGAELSTHLLTSYMGSNPRDMFCEAFMAYIVHGPEFRERAAKSPYLDKYYQALKARVFTTPEGTVEYTEKPEVSLADLEGQIIRWRNEAMKRDEEKRLIKEHEAAKANAIGELVESPEEKREQAWKEEQSLAAQEIAETGGFAGAYYSLALLDETGQRLRSIWGKSNQFADLRDWEQPVVKAMAEALKEDVFERQYGIPTAGFAKQLWERMLAGQKDRALDLIRKKVEKLENAGRISLGMDEQEIFDHMLETARVKMGEGSPQLERISLAISDYVLPGQYARFHLKKIHRILNDPQLKDLEVIRRLYKYISRQGEWGLDARQAVDLTAQLAAFGTLIGKNKGHRELFKLIHGLLEEKTDIYQLAEASGMLPGEIDAFAEGFLAPEPYRDLQARSDREGLRRNLLTSLNIHLSLQTQWKESFPLESIPPELLQGIDRIKSALDALEKNDADALQNAKRVLSDQKHSEAMDGVARDLFQRGNKKAP